MHVKSLIVPAALDSLAEIATFVLAEAENAGLDEKARYRLRLAVDELATNIILHGYAGRPRAAAPALIGLRAQRDETALTVILEDTAVAFDPRQVPPPDDLDLPFEERKIGGLGIYLALGGVDHYSYERVGDRNRNILVVNRQARAGNSQVQEPMAMPPQKGKIAVLVESHFDETEYRRFGEYFPAQGYSVEYLSHLWGHPQLTFQGNDMTAEVVVKLEVNHVAPTDYAGLILIGGYAMDRLRYEESPHEGRPNQAPAVVFLRRAVEAMDAGRLRIGAICHGLWLFCAAPELLKGRKVTCAHNIICDVVNAGGTPIYDGNRLKDTYIHGNLITGRHPGVVEEFMAAFVAELDKHVSK